MGELWRRLGKFVQDLFNKFRRSKKKTILGPGEVYINNVPFGKVESITTLSKDENNWESVKALLNADTSSFQLVYDLEGGINELKNFINTPRTNLPKHYQVKTLIVSIAANQESEYIAVDLSQYEERGIAHFIIGRTLNFQEIEEEYLEAAAQEEVEVDKSTLEWLREGAESDLVSMMYGVADLYYYEDIGEWNFE